MKKILKFRKKSTIIFVTTAIVFTVLLQMVTVSVTTDYGATEEIVASERINPAVEKISATKPITTLATTNEPVEETTVQATTENSTKPQETTQVTTQVASTQSTTQSIATTRATVEPITQKATIAFATAEPVDSPADYNAQWQAGYLIAIDNPDTNYRCGQVNLSDEDRDLLERLCMGEFGSGGFVGAALIAQCVKDAMCFDGYKSVAQVIRDCKYTGSTKIPASTACRQAVAYIFDENHDAVQHRLLYMYNPLLCDSAFHESQNYILTYEDVRFFDRWSY